MCTLIILFRPKHKWPLIIAGNRDEVLDRPWKKPHTHWNEFPSIIAGKDLLAGGTWLGINKEGMVATVLNRADSIGPSKKKKSRGLLPLKVLKHSNINSAVEEISYLKGNNWKPFNLFIGNNKCAYWAKNNSNGDIKINKIIEGKHFLDNHDLNSMESPRLKYNYKKIFNLENPNPDKNYWTPWKDILASKNHPAGMKLAAINIVNSGKNTDYGTSSSSIIAIPSNTEKLKNNSKSIFLFNSGSPEKDNFCDITT